LNEVIVERRTPNVIKLDIFINEAFATTFNCDGVLIASSTGSTAYNVSLGNGVMMHPEVECMILNPMGSISLSSRPLILPKHHAITVKVSPSCTYIEKY
jgi:NAD kinase